MVILYGAGLVLALIIGGAIALLVKAGYYERIASQHGGYEKEIGQRGQFNAALTVLRQITPIDPSDDEVSAA
jgi:hypothetical protein